MKRKTYNNVIKASKMIMKKAMNKKKRKKWLYGFLKIWNN